ncbi:hypothetical protein TgHK011_008336 [Trichoderma gracile]|nr:hypothetical protein TgHK011_008336 [Trichoderma gracile]
MIVVLPLESRVAVQCNGICHNDAVLGSLCVSFDLAECDFIAKWIDYRELLSVRPPVTFLQTRPHIPVFLGNELLVISSDSLSHRDANSDARTPISMMFAEV